MPSIQAHSFELEEDTSSYGAYSRGGIVTQHKSPKTLAFKSLANSLASPGEFLFSDFSKLERSALLHLGFQTLDAFQVRGRVDIPCCWKLANGNAREEDQELQKL